MRIVVTQDDIDRGVPGAAFYCPIARAMDRVCPKARVSVGPWRVSYDSGDGVYTYASLPDVAQTFIRRYDADDPVEPFEFDIELPGARCE